MDYKRVIQDFNNGTIDREKYILVMDNDGGYWLCIDESIDEDQSEKMPKKWIRNTGVLEDTATSLMC